GHPVCLTWLRRNALSDVASPAIEPAMSIDCSDDTESKSAVAGDWFERPEGEQSVLHVLAFLVMPYAQARLLDVDHPLCIAHAALSCLPPTSSSSLQSPDSSSVSGT